MASLFISSSRHAKSSSFSSDDGLPSSEDDGLPSSFSSSEDDAEAFRDLKDKQSQERNTSLPSEKKRAKETSKREAISKEKKIESGAKPLKDKIESRAKDKRFKKTSMLKENESGAKAHKEGKSKPHKERKSMSSKEQEENPSASKRQRSKKQKRASSAPANQVDIGVPQDQLPATATTERVLLEGFFAVLKTAVADVISDSQQRCDSFKIEIESIINKRFKSNSEQ